MKKAAQISVAIGLGGFLLLKSGVASSLMIFLLVGAVPGTSVSLPPTAMLAVISAVAWLIVVNFMATSAFNFVSMKRLIDKHLARRQRMPKRRFGRLAKV